MSATSEPVTFGLSLPNRAVLFGMPVEVLFETAVRAEASGYFDSVWVGDNFLSKPRLEAITMLAALAGRTRQMKLGTICLASFPLRHPLQLAIEWASLDVISNGRTILAVCSGASARSGPEFAAELAAMGIDSRERIPRLKEGIELLRRFWGKEPVSHRGRFYQFDAVEVFPKPVQERVPVVIAVNPRLGGDPAIEARALRRVARIADGWQTDGTPPDLFRERWCRIREYAAEYGRAHEVTHNSLHLMVNINTDEQRARAESVEFLAHYYGDGAIPDAFLENWLAFGSPDAVAEKIGRFIAAGCTTPVLRFTSLDQLGQLERCIADVMPALQGARP